MRQGSTDDPVGTFLEYLAAQRGASAHTLRATRATCASSARGPGRGRSRTSGRATPPVVRGIPRLAQPAPAEPRPRSRASSPPCEAAFASWSAAACSSATPPARCGARARRGCCPPFLPKDEAKDLLDRPPAIDDRGRRADAPARAAVRDRPPGRRAAAGLDVDDLDRGQGTVRVLGKGGKERIVPVRRGRAGRAWPRYLGGRRAGAGPLFRNQRGGRLTARSAHTDRQRRRAREAGIDPAREPAHAAPYLRHAPAGRGRRSAADPGAARPQPAVDHPAVHPRGPGAAHARVRRRPSAGRAPRGPAAPAGTR